MGKQLKVYFAGSKKDFKEWLIFLMLRFEPGRQVKDLPALSCR